MARLGSGNSQKALRGLMFSIRRWGVLSCVDANWRGDEGVEDAAVRPLHPWDS